MNSRHLPCGVLIFALTVALVIPATASTLKTNGDEIVVGVIAGTAAVAVLITVLALHYSKKRTITGCIGTRESGMAVTDDKDMRVYTLSGNTLGIKPGYRMKLHGQKIKLKGPDKTLVWDAREVAKDFGACHP